jgi:hypothetical protein
MSTAAANGRPRTKSFALMSDDEKATYQSWSPTEQHAYAAWWVHRENKRISHRDALPAFHAGFMATCQLFGLVLADLTVPR